MKNLLVLATMILGSFTLSAQYNNCPGGGGGGGGGPQTFGGTSASSITSSQSSFTNGINYTNLLAQSLGGKQALTNQLVYDQMDGSPYLNEEPTKGTLVLNDGTVYDDILLQMDLHTNQAIATLENGEEVFLDSRYFKEISIAHENEIIVFKRANPDRPDRLYQVLYEDAGMTFFKERYATITDAVNTGMVTRDATIKHRNNYFINHGEGEIAKVKLKKKDIFSSFIDDEVYAMKEYAKKKGIKFNNESDYVEVFEAIAEN